MNQIATKRAFLNYPYFSYDALTASGKRVEIELEDKKPKPVEYTVTSVR